MARQLADHRRRHGGDIGADALKTGMLHSAAVIEVVAAGIARHAAGTPLVVLEAMKMEHPMKAGVDGTVRRIGISKGDQVKNRQLLVEIEADPA